MKYQLMTIANALLILVSGSFAHAAGGDSSSGGGSMVCRNADGSIARAESLDLWEASNLPRRDNGFRTLNIPVDSVTPMQEQVTKALGRIQQLNGYAFEKIAAATQVVLQDLQIKELQIKRIPDSNDFAYPKGCYAEQLANFTQDYGVIVNKEIWDHLDYTNQAALILHEAIYKVERDLLGATDSDHTRKVVGFLFSDEPLTYAVFGKLIQICKDVQFVPKTLTGNLYGLDLVINWESPQPSSIKVKGEVTRRACGYPNQVIKFRFATDGRNGGFLFVSDNPMLVEMTAKNRKTGDVMAKGRLVHDSKTRWLTFHDFFVNLGE